MKIAFVGKGGAGKSTTSSLFFLYLLQKQQKALIFDADLNIHVPTILGITIPEEKAISITKNQDQIKRYLIGQSKKIAGPEHMYKTTPPSRGVNIVTLQQDNPVIRDFTVPFQDYGYVGIVGTYEKDEVGRSCYHTNLAILENILSFSQMKDTEWFVADMVAGIDAFSNTLHMQFDALFLVVEPSIEGVTVYQQYKELSEHAGVYDRLFVIANKLEDEKDEAYLQNHIDAEKIIARFYRHTAIKHLRQEDKPLTADILTDDGVRNMQAIENIARKNQVNDNIRLQQLHELHKKYVAQDYVRNAVGDITDQIDHEFSFL